MKTNKNSDWQKRFVGIVFLLVLLSAGTAKSQVFEVKKWTDTYPEMEESYPLGFISFTGWLIPLPHVFIRTWPTHYYVEVGALPVTDAPEFAGQIKTGLLRIAFRMIERHQMKGRHDETEQIKSNTDFQKQIEEKLFNARLDELEDIYQLAEGFIELYKKVDRMGELQNASEIKKIYEEEAGRMLMRFLMVNILETEHGEKLDAFSEISLSLNKLLGEADYTYSKIRFFSSYGEETITYSFLIH